MPHSERTWMIMTRTMRVLAVVTLTMVAVSVASAGVTDWLPATPAVYDGYVNWSTYLSVPKFDVTLGALTMVEWRMAAYTYGSVTYTNKTNSAVPAYGNLASKVTLERPGGGVIATALPYIPWDLGSPGLGTYTTGPLVSPVATATGFLTTGLASFEGPGTIPFAANAVAASTYTGSANSSWRFVTKAHAEMQVRYTYDGETTPEWPSGALLLLGIVPVALVWRKRRAA